MAQTIVSGGLSARPAPELAPRSARWPWSRAGLSGLIAALLPFTWVLQIDGCTETVQGSRTGLDLLRDVHFGFPDLALALAILIVALVAPRWSGIVNSVSMRLGIHVLGLVTTAALVFHGLSLVFGTVELRAIQPAGYLVLAALLTGLIEATARVVLGAVEWTDDYRGGYARDG